MLLVISARLDGPAETFAGVFGVGAELLFDAEDLVVLGETFRTAGRAGLDLTGRQTHYEVSDECVLCLTRPAHKKCYAFCILSMVFKFVICYTPVGNHGAPSVLFG